MIFPMSTVLSVKDLRTEFRMRTANVVAVDGVSFDIAAGECVGLVGESGCGKTTIGTSIMRLLPTTGHIIGGSIELEGVNLATLTEEAMQKVRGNQVAFIPQDPMTSLNPTMTIGRQIAEGYVLHKGVSNEEGLKRAIEVLKLVEMPRPEERINQYPHELSGGELQRICLARALSSGTRYLLCDEMTSMLDALTQAHIWQIILDIARSRRLGLLVISHDTTLITRLCSRNISYFGDTVNH